MGTLIRCALNLKSVIRCALKRAHGYQHVFMSALIGLPSCVFKCFVCVQVYKSFAHGYLNVLEAIDRVLQTDTVPTPDNVDSHLYTNRYMIATRTSLQFRPARAGARKP